MGHSKITIYNTSQQIESNPPSEALLSNLEKIKLNLTKEWHPTKNHNRNLSDFSWGSNYKPWWLCKQRHEWSASIKSRAAGSGCPYCSNKKVGRDNCLAVTNPPLSKEWDFCKNGDLTPENFTAGSDKKAWWKCPKNHSWQAIIKDRNKGRGCPYCSGKRASPDNNFAQSFPGLLSEWHEKNSILPSNITPKSSKKVWWICAKGHEWEERVAARANGYGCPFCANKRISVENCLTNNSLLVTEWDYHKNNGLLPSHFSLNSKKRVWWICKKKHSWVTCPVF